MGALAFAMQSCEYSTTSEKNPKTKRLQLRNIIIYAAGGTKMNQFFHMAKYVKITFKNQENGEKMETITK